MSRRWFQFRLRTLLIAVTLVAVSIVLVQRSQRFREAARHRACGVNMASACAESIERSPWRYHYPFSTKPPPPLSPERERKAQEWRELVEYHRRIQRKYERAAWLPFFPVAPDPPHPPIPGGAFGRPPYYEWKD